MTHFCAGEQDINRESKKQVKEERKGCVFIQEGTVSRLLFAFAVCKRSLGRKQEGVS